ncbi:FAD dependent oxidoreductase [Amylocarpus encephaloides]|uniref:FAD dependent oxidoreductase n=1 Tax=Amylocarpus encephaloides TaxID=45428 RepID=A0A9P7YGG7_9HELO|nr:FAD dependent oxidoreductase [Amylocarpus encephaloides]
MAPPNRDSIVVIGAGVIGLQVALTLLTESSAEKKPRVTIVASAFPGSFSPHYTSPWAGGQWRTHASRKTPEGCEQCDWDVQTYRYWKNLVASEKFKPPSRASGSGVAEFKSHFVWDEINDEIRPLQPGGPLGTGLWWKHEVDDFRILPNSERPSNTIFGVEWTSFCFNVPRYLQYLLAKVEEHGGRCVQLTLPTTAGLENAITVASGAVDGKVDLFINATGLAAGKVAGDSKVFPTRGQTVLVEGEAQMARTRKGDGYIAYTIPRPGSGTTVLGGCNEAGNWDEKIDESLHEKILERTKILAPELLDSNGSHTILSRQVGFRPSRQGGPRVEFENVSEKLVLHCYGHGGAGYQNSIGCSRKVLTVVEEVKRKSVIEAKL